MTACPQVYPLTFTPQLRAYLWGGRTLEKLFGRILPPGPVAESWEISGYPRSPTAVESGYWAGRPLTEVTLELGERLLGINGVKASPDGRFPLLVKLLDAQADLSVQVHPPNAYALAHEQDLGKSEAWYILHAPPGAQLIYGLARGVDRDRFVSALQDGTVPALLHRVAVAPGDVVHVPAGTVHALMAGIVAVEVQQTSDATYRIYDWGRVGRNGDARPLHIAKALDVIDWTRIEPPLVTPEIAERDDGLVRMRLVNSAEFVLEALRFDAGGCWRNKCDGATFEIWGCLEGSAMVQARSGAVPLPAIRFVLLPASLGRFEVHASTAATLLRVYVPSPEQPSG